MSTKEMIEDVKEGKYSEFKEKYKKTMQDKYNENSKIVKNYVYKQISSGKETMI